MNIQEKSRIEYRSRINRVMDYIDIHFDQPLELKNIAEIANFSPYHFHRIFTFLTGETPIDYSTYELYHNDYSTHPEKKHIVDICIPVKHL